MYLKEIHMENFKSFGKKLKIPFFPGFTAITGPNGSGKSNIADAILFVLGPKSSKVMRAGRLTDLIFNGGKKHKNPSKSCKVSLIFDNHERRMPLDEDKIVLTRMIKRAPLKDDPDNYYSRFYVNGKSSSFSEFENLLQHARMSGDGYNIVKQGDITNIIEMGNVDRRRIIDDIAGISNFDKDIEKAKKEEVDVDENLERIKIILNEINTRIRQLKKDRDEAQRYKELKDQLYKVKAKIALKKKHDVQTQISEIQKQIESYEKEKNTLDEKSRDLKKQYHKLQEQLEELENKIAEVGGDEVKEIKEKIENIRGEEIKVEERINFSKNETRELKQKNKELKQKIEDVEKELEEYKNQKNTLEAEIVEKKEILKEKNSKLNSMKEDIASSDDKSMDLSHELAKMRKEHDEKNSRVHELKLKRNRFTDKIEALEVQIAELEETLKTYDFELKDIEWQKNEFKKEHGEHSKKTKKLEKQLFDKKKEQTDLSEQLSDIENSIRRLQREKSKLQAEFEAAERVNQQYNRAVNEIIKLRDMGELLGVHGTIAELANVDEKFQTAVEIAAGGRMQSVVVDDDGVAEKAIKYLQSKNLGRATFLPLNKMHNGKPRGNALMAVKDEKAHGFAIDLVDFKKEYQGAFWYVFRDTVVVESLKDARRLMGGVRLVDLKGSLVESSGAMRGGSKPRHSLSFSKKDKGKLLRVSEELEKAMHHQDELSEKIKEIKTEIAEIENELSGQKVDGKENNLKDLEVRKNEFDKKIDIVKKELSEKTEEKNTLVEKKNNVLSEIEEIKKRLDELNNLKEEKSKLLLKGTKKELAQKSRDLENKVTSLQEEVNSLESEINTVSKKTDLLKDKKDETQKEFKETEEKIKEHSNKIEEFKKKRQGFRDELKTLMNVEKKMTGKIKDLTTERDQLYRKTVTVENQIDSVNTRVESYYDLISRAKYRMPTLESSIDELEQELKLYDVDLDEKEKLPNVESLKDSVQTIESTMKELEPVNMRALDEYNHQTERKSKLDEDVKHLKDQKKNLVKLVSEITEKKKEKFFEVYDAVNVNLKKIYSQLSEGGEAELKLEDPDNVFESGLTIKARPRGKKVLLLSALSGGEKSIASLAFIFAIQQFDPSPFYVLDEVDMFLDGVNAETVSRMVKNNAEDSQFIMVSLRKIALKEANYVYGVTMRENGVSDMIGNVDPKSVGPKGELNIGKKVKAVAAN